MEQAPSGAALNGAGIEWCGACLVCSNFLGILLRENYKRANDMETTFMSNGAVLAWFVQIFAEFCFEKITKVL